MIVKEKELTDVQISEVSVSVFNSSRSCHLDNKMRAVTFRET